MPVPKFLIGQGPCRAATIGPVSLAGLEFKGALFPATPPEPGSGPLAVFDEQAISVPPRALVLVKDQTAPTQNGIYIAATSAWTLATDANTNTSWINGTLVTVAQGAVNAGLTFVMTCVDVPVQIGVSNLTFVNQSAVATAQQSGTSTASLTVGTGSKAFTGVGTGKAFQVGQWVLAQETSNAANQMFGKVTAYSGGTLTVNVTATGGGPGPYADWTLVLYPSNAAAGFAPPIGTGNVTGPGSSTTGHIATYADATGKVLADGGAPVGAANTITPLMFATQSAALGCTMLNGQISVTATAGALQCAVKTFAGTDPSASDPVFFVFRSATASSGALTIIEVTAALSLTTAGQVLGTAGFSTNTPGRLWFVATNNGGTVALGVMNCLSGTNIAVIAGQGITNTTAMGASGSNNAGVIYAQATVSALPYSIIGYASWEAATAGALVMTAGTWITPSRVETYRPGVALPGQVVQTQFASTGANAATANTYTISNTAPAPGNGAAATSVQITPSSSANVLRVRGQAVVGNTGSPAQVFAYIHDGTSTRAAGWGAILSAQVETVGAQWQTQAGQLAQYTYTLYYASNNAGTVIKTHTAATAELGGTANTFIQAEEIMA